MPKQERLTLIGLTLLGLLTAVVSFSNLYLTSTKLVPTVGGEYREGIIGQPKFINPVLSTTGVDKTINRLVYSGLYNYDEMGNIVPDLAEAMPEIDETKKIYTIKLRQNALWHNGLPFNADDVIFTIQSLQKAEYNSPRRSEWQATTVEKTDNYTLVFTLKNASAPFIQNLTIPIISKTVWSKISPEEFSLSNSNIEAVGTGPYQIKEVRKTADGSIQSITLKSFKDFYLGQAFIETFKLSFFENKEEIVKAIHGKQIDGFGYSPLEKDETVDKSSKNFVFTTIPLPQYEAVFFNLNRKALQDSKVRKALQLGTNYQAIIDDVFGGQGKRIYGPILPEQVNGIHNISERFNTNIEIAQQILEESGWVLQEGSEIRTKNGSNLELTLSTNELPVNTQAAELLVKQWRELGVKTTLNILPTKDLTEKVIFPRDFDALLFAQKLGADPDPFIFWHSSQVKDPGLNLSGYENPVVDKLINEARSSNDKVSREAKYTDFQKIIINDAPAIFLVQNIYSYGQKNIIKGLNYKTLSDETLRFSQAAKWYIDTKRVFN